MSEQKTLYERLGGYEAIYKFAEDVIARAMNDDEIGHIWDHMSQDRILNEHQNFVDWLCEHFGGPMMYRGRDLLTVHRGMGITERYWDVTFEKIGEAYEKFGLSKELREEVDAFLRSFKPQIVGSPSFRKVVRGPDGQSFAGGMESYGVRWPAGQQPSSKPPKRQP
ncbi:MAG: group I truncated hemoglobin [Candidatus Binataceae bacterium]